MTAAPPQHAARAASLTLEVEATLVSQFRAEARARDVPVARLLYDLLDVIAQDRLTGAILDDGKGSDGSRSGEHRAAETRATDTPKTA